MENEIPKINFSKEENLDIEVMNFQELINKLDQTVDHNPFAVHKIEFYLILVVTQNSYTHYVDFKPYQLTKGSALFVAKNQVHHFSETLRQADGYGIVFNNVFIEKNHFLSSKHKFNRLFNYHIETPIIHQKEIGQDSFIGIVQNLYKEYFFPNAFAKSEILSSLLQTLLLKAERAKESQSIQGVKTQWLEIFCSFKDLLEQEYTKTRSSRHYASRLLVSYKFLNDVVKQLTGKTAKTFIDEFVILEIKRYLVSTSLSIKEIAFKTGFEEPANMAKFFKKNTQLTPLKYRQQLLA